MRVIYFEIGISSTHVKEIPNSNLIVSLYHDIDASGKMEIFDISKRGKVKKIYSFGIVYGGKFLFYF